MAGEQEQISITIGGDSSPLVREFKKAKTGANKAGADMSRSLGKELRKIEKDAARAGRTMRERMTSALNAVKSGAAGATKALGAMSGAAVAAGAAFKKLADAQFGTIDQMNTFAQATGLSMDTVNGLRRAALNANKDISEIMPKNLAKNIQEVAAGTGRATAAFVSLGIEATDSSGALRSTDEVLFEALDKLSRIEDPTARAALAIKVLGNEGRNMLSAFDNADGLRDAVEQSREFGIAAGPAAVASSNAWWKATSNLTVAFEDAGFALLEAFGPKVTKFVNDLSLGFIQLSSFITELPKHGFDFSESWGAATERARKFWELNIRAAPEAEAAIDGVHRSNEAIKVDFAEMLNMRDQYTKALRGQLVPALEEVAGTEAMMAANGIQHFDDIGTAAQEAADAISESFDDAADDVGFSFQEQMQGALELFSTVMGMASQAAMLHTQQVAQRGREWLDTLANMEGVSEATMAKAEQAQKRRVEEAFKRTQALQIAAATIESIRAGIAMIPGFAFLGPGAPVAAAALAAASLGIAIAGIKAQQPPSFPVGGIVEGYRPDHTIIRAQPGEGVANLRAMGDDSFREALERANAGEPIGNRAPAAVGAVLTLDRRLRRLRIAHSSGMPGKRPHVRR